MITEGEKTVMKIIGVVFAAPFVGLAALGCLLVVLGAKNLVYEIRDVGKPTYDVYHGMTDLEIACRQSAKAIDGDYIPRKATEASGEAKARKHESNIAFFTEYCLMEETQ